MCIKCTAPNDRYYVLDIATGLLVCEECGFAVRNLTAKAKDDGSYIWFLNPRWPRFQSFSHLLSMALDGRISIPECIQYGFIPSRLLTAAFNFLCDSGSRSS